MRASESCGIRHWREGPCPGVLLDWELVRSAFGRTRAHQLRLSQEQVHCLSLCSRCGSMAACASESRAPRWMRGAIRRGRTTTWALLVAGTRSRERSRRVCEAKRCSAAGLRLRNLDYFRFWTPPSFAMHRKTGVNTHERLTNSRTAGAPSSAQAPR